MSLTKDGNELCYEAVVKYIDMDAKTLNSKCNDIYNKRILDTDSLLFLCFIMAKFTTKDLPIDSNKYLSMINAIFNSIDQKVVINLVYEISAKLLILGEEIAVTKLNNEHKQILDSIFDEKDTVEKIVQGLIKHGQINMGEPN
jgi:hypothetical protein